MAKECGVEILKHQTHVKKMKCPVQLKKLYLEIPQSLFMKLWKSVR